RCDSAATGRGRTQARRRIRQRGRPRGDDRGRAPRARGRALIGFVLVDKPAGPTSHDIVARVRKLLGVKRVGHAGTLDPTASGLLVVGVGAATRLLQYVQGLPKTYEATGRLGVRTTTLDAAGEVVDRVEVDVSPDEI